MSIRVKAKKGFGPHLNPKYGPIELKKAQNDLNKQKHQKVKKQMNKNEIYQFK